MPGFIEQSATSKQKSELKIVGHVKNVNTNFFPI